METGIYGKIILLAGITGFVGGAISGYLIQGVISLDLISQTQKRAIQELRVHRLTVIDEAGATRIVLGDLPTSPPDIGLSLLDQTGKERAQLLLLPDGSPSLVMQGKKDGHAHLTINPSDDNPTLTLNGGAGNEVGIGIFNLPNSGATSFVDVSSKGTSAEMSVIGTSATVKLFHPLTDKGSAAMSLENGFPTIEVSDGMLNAPRAVLGHTSTVISRTGVSLEHPASSLLMFNKKGNVIWHAP
jgi:hypothetical protein